MARTVKDTNFKMRMNSQKKMALESLYSSLGIPEAVIADMFRGKYLCAMKMLYDSGKLDLSHSEHLKQPREWKSFIDRHFRIRWLPFAPVRYRLSEFLHQVPPRHYGLYNQQTEHIRCRIQKQKNRQDKASEGNHLLLLQIRL